MSIELVKQLFRPIDVQELQDPEKVSANLVKNLNSIISKMNKTKWLMIDTKLQDEFKLDIEELQS